MLYLGRKITTVFLHPIPTKYKNSNSVLYPSGKIPTVFYIQVGKLRQYSVKSGRKILVVSYCTFLWSIIHEQKKYENKITQGLLYLCTSEVGMRNFVIGPQLQFRYLKYSGRPKYNPRPKYTRLGIFAYI